MGVAKVFFVFLTPNSLDSDWIFFEAGYAYRKDIRVIPIGFIDVDLGNLPPPLGLLQGFNVTSSEGLNNLIAVVNKEFTHSHGLSFADVEFNELLTTYRIGTDGALKIAGGVVRDIKLSISVREGFQVPPVASLKTIAEILAKHKVEHVAHDRLVLCHGAKFTIPTNVAPEHLEIDLDPLSAPRLCPILEEAFRTILIKGISAAPFHFMVDKNLANVSDAHKITSRLYGTMVTLGEIEDWFTYHFKTIKFCVDHRLVSCTCCGERIAFEEMVELLNLLFERRVIGVAQNE
jgi:hypothetical protein